MNKRSLKRKIFSISASIMFLSFIGFGNLCFNQKVYAEITKSENEQFEKLSKAIGISSEEISNCLKFSCGKQNEYSCELVIIDGSDEHKDCYISLFAETDSNEGNKEKSEYMQYYLDGKLKSKDYVESWFSRSVNRINDPLPNGITLMIKVNNEVVGRIGLGPLTDSKNDPEIGYAIKKEFSSKGITKHAVSASINFLKLLISSGKYNFKKLRATAKEKNISSNKLLSDHKFIKSEKLIDDGYGPELEYYYYFNEENK